MKLLVSTKRTQGQRANDFCWLPEGEIVYPATACSSGHVDDECGCRRALAGVVSHKASTTFCVQDTPYTRTDLRGVVKLALTSAGFGASAKIVSLIVQRMTEWAEPFEIGTVVEYRDGVVQARPED